MKSEEQRKQQRDERRASKIPNYWYKPWTKVPAVIKQFRTPKGKLITKIISREYFKLTHKPGTIIESGKQRYEVQEDGSIRNLTKAEKRKGQIESQKGG